MEKFEKCGYLMLIVGVVIYGVAEGIAFFYHTFTAYSVAGLAVFLGITLLAIKVVFERIGNKDDNHYSREVKQ